MYSLGGAKQTTPFVAEQSLIWLPRYVSCQKYENKQVLIKKSLVKHNSGQPYFKFCKSQPIFKFTIFMKINQIILIKSWHVTLKHKLKTVIRLGCVLFSSPPH